MDFLRVGLRASGASLPELGAYYGDRLDLEVLEQTDELVGVRAGLTRIDFRAHGGEPFYHVALLAPGDRFEPLLDWVAARVELLPDRGSGETVFDFSNWQALACYFHDPAGNIVELIAHRGIGEAGASGAFSGRELLGVSELGIVGEPAAAARTLHRELGLQLWDGTVDRPGGLGFVGERARTLILCPADRPWLPTGRPAEIHPVEATISASIDAEAQLPESRSAIRLQRA